MKFIRKALWPTAIVTAVLMLFGALGNAINAETLGDVQSSSGDDVVQAGEEVAVYVVVAGTPDPATAKKAAAVDALNALVDADSPRSIIATEADLRKALIAAGVVADAEADPLTVSSDADTAIDALRAAIIIAINPDSEVSAVITALGTIDTQVTVIKGEVGTIPGAVDYTEDYTVEVDGNAEIIQVLLASRTPGTEDAPETVVGALTLKSQPSGRTRTDVSPVAVDADDIQGANVATTDVLKGFDLPSGDLLLVVVECESGSFDVSFDSDSDTGISETATFDCQGGVAVRPFPPPSPRSTALVLLSPRSRLRSRTQTAQRLLLVALSISPPMPVSLATARLHRKLSLRQTAATQSPKPPWTAQVRMPVLPRSRP